MILEPSSQAFLMSFVPILNLQAAQETTTKKPVPTQAAAYRADLQLETPPRQTRHAETNALKPDAATRSL